VPEAKIHADGVSHVGDSDSAGMRHVPSRGSDVTECAMSAVPFGRERSQAPLQPTEEQRGANEHVTLVDDVDGSPAAETLTFGLDTTVFEIDLNEMHAADLREVLAPYISVARPVGRTPGRRSSRGSRTAKTAPKASSPAEIRAWAQDNGLPVSVRGRINKQVLEQFRYAKG